MSDAGHAIDGQQLAELLAMDVEDAESVLLLLSATDFAIVTTDQAQFARGDGGVMGVHADAAAEAERIVQADMEERRTRQDAEAVAAAMAKLAETVRGLPRDRENAERDTIARWEVLRLLEPPDALEATP